VRALKDSLIGAGGYGVSLIVILMSLYCMSSLSWDIMAQVDNTWTKFITVAFIVWPLEILIKNAQVAAAAFGKPGNGMAANQVGNTELNDVLLTTALTTVLVIITSLISWGIGSLCTINTELPLATVILLMLVAILMSVGVGYLMAYVSNKTFGFVNGDVLGATNEISRAAILLITLILLTVSLW
jgi:adenosylcobinamide-GDP ribazoletransferase